jgi:hypothetical protein
MEVYSVRECQTGFNVSYKSEWRGRCLMEKKGVSYQAGRDVVRPAIDGIEG